MRRQACAAPGVACARSPRLGSDSTRRGVSASRGDADSGVAGERTPDRRCMHLSVVFDSANPSQGDHTAAERVRVDYRVTSDMVLDAVFELTEGRCSSPQRARGEDRRSGDEIHCDVTLTRRILDGVDAHVATPVRPSPHAAACRNARIADHLDAVRQAAAAGSGRERRGEAVRERHRDRSATPRPRRQRVLVPRHLTRRVRLRENPSE